MKMQQKSLYGMGLLFFIYLNRSVCYLLSCPFLVVFLFVSSSFGLQAAPASKNDRKSPTVSISSPTTGTTYTSAQTIAITASASDNVGVSKVELYKDGKLFCSDAATPFSCSWSITDADNGTHSWAAKAYDAAGNSTLSAAVNLNVDIPLSAPPGSIDTQPPTVSISSPTSGSTYTSAQTIAIEALASDNVGVSKVELYKDGALFCSDTATPFSCSWSITDADNGTHSWAAKTYDTAGNVATSTAVSLTVNIDTGLPTVSISSPTSGTTYTSAQTIAITASGSDNVGVSKVELYKDGALFCSDAATPFSCSWSITSADNGTRSWAAKAYDAAGNVTTSTAVNLTVNIPSTAGAHLWSLQFGGATTTDVASGQVTAIDPWGSVFVAALVRGAVDFGDGLRTSNGGIVLAKYDAGGNILWSRQWTRESSAEFYVRGLIVNSDGSVVVTGYYYGTINFGGGTHTSVGGYDMYLVKYSSNGQYQWSRSFGASGSEVPNAIAADSRGNLYTTGYVQGSVNLGGGAISTNGGSRDVFLAKYSASGAHLWSKAFGGTSTDEGFGVAVDINDNPWITGSFQGTINFGDNPLNSVGMSDIFVAGYASDGTLPNSWSEGGAGRDSGRSIAIDGLGNLVLATQFEGTVSFGGAKTLSSAGYVDIAILQYSSIGSLRWARKIGGSWNDAINSMAVNAAGEIAVTGTFNSWVDISGASYFADGSVNIYIAKFNSSGARLWARIGGLDWDDYGNGIDLDNDGEVVATGSFYKGIDLGGGLMSTVVGSNDGYLVRFAP